GKPFNATVPPGSVGSSDLGFINLLYEIPTPGNPISSIGQLQHFNTNAHIEAPYLKDGNSFGGDYAKPRKVQAWQSNYPIGNSYVHNLVSRDEIFDTGYSGYHYD